MSITNDSNNFVDSNFSLVKTTIRQKKEFLLKASGRNILKPSLGAGIYGRNGHGGQLIDLENIHQRLV